MKVAVLLLTLALALAAQAQNVEYYLAFLNGTNENPSNNSPYTGKAFVAFYPDTSTFTFRIITNVPFASNSHIHQGAVGVNGPVIYGLPRTNGIVNNHTNLSIGALTADNLRNKLYYVNVHTIAIPAGEIRGQLLAAPSCNNGVRDMFDCVCNPAYTGIYCDILKTCPSEIYGRASWSATPLNATASGICEPGSIGNPTRVCTAAGTWSPNVANVCQKRICLAESLGEIDWPAIPSLSTFTTYCPIGFSGVVSRTCGALGTWDPIQGQCTPSSDCPAESYASASWPATVAGGTAQGTCNQGHSGSPTRTCSSSGTWATNVSPHCTRNTCPAQTVDGVSFPKSLSLTVVPGTCAAGTFGNPTRACLADGTWDIVSGSCNTNGQCPPELYGRANWSLTNGGSTATGTCIAGWTGAPQRRCLPNGTWATAISFHCVRI